MTAASSNSDPGATLSAVGSAAKALAPALDAVVPGLGQVANAAGQVVQSFAALMGEIDKTVDRYAQYSPEISQAKAVAEIRQTMGDFRRAQEGSEELSKYVLARSEAEQKFEDIKIKVLVQILPVVTAILEMIGDAVSGTEGIAEAIGNIANPLTAICRQLGLMTEAHKESRIKDIKDPTTLILESQGFETTHRGGRGGFVPDA